MRMLSAKGHFSVHIYLIKSPWIPPKQPITQKGVKHLNGAVLHNNLDNIGETWPPFLKKKTNKNDIRGCCNRALCWSTLQDNWTRCYFVPPCAGASRVRRFWSPSSLDGARTKTRVREKWSNSPIAAFLPFFSGPIVSDFTRFLFALRVQPAARFHVRRSTQRRSWPES